MQATDQIYTNNGFIVLVDGTKVFIDRVQYSHDGKGDWEDPPFKSFEHENTITGVGTLPEHRYRRTMLAGTNLWQDPEYIVAEDGKSVELKVENDYIYWRLIGDANWTSLIPLVELKGNQGEQGAKGTGINIDITGAFDNKPVLSSTVVTQGCCNGTTVVTAGVKTFLSVGNHKLSAVYDTNTYFKEVEAGSWTLFDPVLHEGKYVMYWGGTDNTGTNAYTVKGIVIAQGNTGGEDTKGWVYAFADGYWIKFINLTISDHLLQESLGSSHIGYMDSYTSAGTTTTNQGIGLKSGKLSILDNAIDIVKIDPAAIGTTLQILSNKLEVNSSEIVGYGLTSTSNNLDVNPSALNGDGIQISGNKFVVKTENLLNVSNPSGLKTVDSDDLSGGVCKHIQVDNGDTLKFTSNKLDVKVNTSEGIDSDTNGIKLKVAGILAKHLSADTVDNATIILNPVNNKLQAVLPTNYVKSLNAMTNSNIILAHSNTTTTDAVNPIKLNLNTDTLTKTITVILNVDYNNLKTILNVPDPIAGTFIIKDNEYVSGQNIEDDIITKVSNRLQLDTKYGNAKIVSTGGNAGLQLTPDNGTTWFKINVDNSGNLFPTPA